MPGIGEVPLIELIPRLLPIGPVARNERPEHLAVLCEAVDRAIEPHAEKFFYWVSVPPGHWKTTTLDYAIVKYLARWPDRGAAYISHTDRFAFKQGRDVRRVCESLDWKIRDDVNTMGEWELVTGGGLVAKGIGTASAGRRFGLIVCDDPFANREQAKSPTERDKIFNAIEEDLVPRLLPGGSLFLVHTRWDPDDAIGRYRRRGWDGVNIPAVRGMGDPPDYEGGEALRPDIESLESLKKILKVNPAKFYGLYQGDPRPPGMALFKEPMTYEWGYQPREGRVAYGVDCAYTEKGQARADFSVCVKLWATRGEDGRPRYYVLDVVRRQVQAPEFTLALKAMHSQHPGPMLWHIGGTEKGVYQFMTERVPALRTRPAVGDPYQRAQGLAEAWNDGRVLVPAGEARPDWVEDFVDEFLNFSGVPGKGRSPDQIVATASAFDLFEERRPDWEAMDAIQKAWPRPWVDGGDGGGVGW